MRMVRMGDQSSAWKLDLWEGHSGCNLNIIENDMRGTWRGRCWGGSILAPNRIVDPAETWPARATTFDENQGKARRGEWPLNYRAPA
jgi:hypothetical protein